MNQNLTEKLKNALGEEKVLIKEPMRCHTTFRIGGPADLFLLPETVEDICRIVDICQEEEAPYFVLGNGSNLLVSDSGYRGVIIQTFRNFSKIQVEGVCIRAQAGALLSGIASAGKNASLTGFEFAGGIPGTLGGAVFMNAGAYEGEMKDVIQQVAVLTRDGKLRKLTCEEMEFGYRTSIVKKAGWIVLEAVLGLREGKKEEILSRMQELTKRRVSKQPLEYPSAGSTFKRPEGHFAGKLIMESGLAGYQVGGARVSEKHCGFVINAGGASARDVRQLMEDVQARVYEKFQVRLEPEVKFLGDF